MKCVAIGDIHGRDKWKKIAEKVDQYDKIIFNGDYVDSYDKTDEEIIINLAEIIDFKKANPEKVELLLGNHDMMYFHLGNQWYNCSGFRPGTAVALHQMFMDNKDLFNVAWQHDNHLFTHAGVCNGWYNKFKTVIDDVATKFETKNLAETFNHMHRMSIGIVLAQVGYVRGGDRYDKGGIFWADRRETMNESLIGYHQVVGHTPIERIERFGDPESDTTIRYIDVLGHSDEFYEFEL
jgi:hypothetical protein